MIYAKKTASPEIKYIANCMNMGVADMLKTTDNDCLQIVISPYNATYFTKEQRKELINRLNNQYTKAYLTILSGDLDEQTLMNYPASDTLRVINDTGKQFRLENFNLLYSKKFMDYLSTSSKISRLIQTVVRDKSYDNLQLSIMLLDGKNLDANSDFLLALNYVNHNKLKEAVEFFGLSNVKAGSGLDADKAVFWQYLITHDKKYLDQLGQSNDINIYSLYAYELLNKKVTNYFTESESSLGAMTPEENIKDPFTWIIVNKNIKNTPREQLAALADKYDKAHLLPLKSVVLERIYGFKKDGFIMPYTEYTKDLSHDDQAFMYALMRQESHFIPSAISSSYALGLMQIMPFLVDDLQKRMPLKIESYNDMFEPKYNIAYAAKHLQWLDKQMDSPLLKAYAYNAGAGYTRRYLESGRFTDAQYEPFWSMDMMQNSESREYGKKVLANYVMYKKILGDDVSIVHLLDSLKVAKRNDHFVK